MVHLTPDISLCFQSYLHCLHIVYLEHHLATFFKKKVYMSIDAFLVLVEKLVLFEQNFQKTMAMHTTN